MGGANDLPIYIRKPRPIRITNRKLQ